MVDSNFPVTGPIRRSFVGEGRANGCRISVAGAEPASDAGSRWYVVHTQSRAEARAKWHLQNQGFECFLPRLRKVKRHARRTYEVCEPVFPRYLFTRFDTGSSAWRSINGSRGVVGLILSAGRPAAVPDGVVEALAAETDETGVTPLNAIGVLRQGREVELLTGAFRGKHAKIEADAMEGDDRVRVLLTMLGAATRLEVPSYAVEPA